MTTKIVITPFHFLPARSSAWWFTLIRKDDFTDSRKISNLVQKIITGHYFTI